MQTRGRLHCVVAVARLAQHFDFGVVLQHAAKASPHQGVVVDQQYGNR